MPREISFPSEIGGWKWDGKAKNYNSRTLFDYIDGAAELFLAYGFKNLTVRRLEKPGQPPIVVEVYEMGSSEDAYGVFSFERQDEDAGIGQGSEFGGGLLRFWKGKYFVSIYAEGEGSGVESGILSVGKAVAQSIGEIGREPKLISYLPGEPAGLVERSLRFIRSHVLLNQRFFVAHRNILNLNPKTEAVLAQYLRNRQKSHLLLIRYSTVREAGEGFQSFTKAYMPEAAGKDRLLTEDRKWTFARQNREFVLIVFGASNEADGEELLQAAEEKILMGR
ncbi:MAG: hypothetical protein HY882_10640 [Deltaproteobacteria bacterium]|nr:hypothetical protein [Deltaproteobacteria bacterium]